MMTRRSAHLRARVYAGTACRSNFVGRRRSKDPATYGGSGCEGAGNPSAVDPASYAGFHRSNAGAASRAIGGAAASATSAPASTSGS